MRAVVVKGETVRFADAGDPPARPAAAAARTRRDVDLIWGFD